MSEDVFGATPYQSEPQGMLTGVKERLLGSEGLMSGWITSTHYYDLNGRICQTVEEMFGGGKQVSLYGLKDMFRFPFKGRVNRDNGSEIGKGYFTNKNGINKLQKLQYKPIKP